MGLPGVTYEGNMEKMEVDRYASGKVLAHRTNHGRGIFPELGTHTPDPCQAATPNVLYYQLPPGRASAPKLPNQQRSVAFKPIRHVSKCLSTVSPKELDPPLGHTPKSLYSPKQASPRTP